MKAPLSGLHARLAVNIRYWAGRRGVVLSHLPDRAGVGRSHFWAVLDGRASPTVQWIEKLAAALEVDGAELFQKRSPESRPRRRGAMAR